MRGMRKGIAAAGSAAFFVAAPGVVTVLVPWGLTGWQIRTLGPYAPLLRTVGIVVVVAGGAVLVAAFARFMREGSGTPAPVAPTEHLVVGGLYRYVRNPMYLAVVAVIVGQALVLGQPVLLLYALVVLIATASFVRWYEEPMLTDRYGERYEAYRRAVPPWRPRLRPWDPAALSQQRPRSTEQWP
jgi:protein-S-isoprenylcysteine O-methyltransferase Ste14